MNLSDYVKKRNGVPLGATDSLRNMLFRSLRAGRFPLFWKYWNPIWGFYLGKYVFRPFKTILPSAPSILLTFTLSGFFHDLVIMLLKRNFELLLTPWFLSMGLCVVLSDSAKIDYSKFT